MKRRAASLALACTALGCGGAGGAPPAPAPAAPTGVVAAPPSASGEVQRLMLDAAAARACNQLRGRFIGLPAPSALEGADAGLVPSAGRLWVQSCTSRLEGGALRVRFAGLGWTFVDQTSHGFRVAQHVYFTTDVELGGTLDVGYDEASRIASVWLVPTTTADVRVEPLGEVNGRADTLWAEVLLKGSLGLAGKAVDAAARREVGVVGAAQLRERLGRGATITLDLARDQVDLALGRLPRGVTPRRPFDEPVAWLVDERQLLQPGGVQAAGPFAPMADASLDYVVEQGAAVAYRLLCATDAERVLQAVTTGQAPTLPPADARTGGRLARTTARATLTLTPPACPWVLLTSTEGGEPTQVALRLRPGAPTDRALAAESAVVRVTLVSFRLDARRPGGGSWDPFGGAPDPAAWIASDRVRHPLGPPLTDRLEATPLASAPEPLEVTRRAPLRIGVDDVDLGTADEPMGTALLSLADALTAGPEIELSLRLSGVVTGSVRLRVELLAQR